MDAEILDLPPLSGDDEEHHFSVTGPMTWVEFRDDRHLKWVGIFAS